MAGRKTKAPRKTTSMKKTRAKQPTSIDTINSQLQLEAYRAIERQINVAWAKLQNDIKRRASPQILLEDKNHLMLLLGECNYLARECVRWIDLLPQQFKKPARRM